MSTGQPGGSPPRCSPRRSSGRCLRSTPGPIAGCRPSSPRPPSSSSTPTATRCRQPTPERPRKFWRFRRPSRSWSGAAGVGESHLATALCYQALLQGYQTVFITLFDFTSKLAKAKSPYTLIEYYSKAPLLCLDELGNVVPSKEQADALFQIISKRTEVRTTIVTTNLIPSQWGKIFDSVTASAILDRLSMNGRLIIWEGRSCRSKK